MLLITLLLVGCGAPTETAAPTASPKPKLSGRLTFAGSTTVQPLAQRLAEAYRLQTPNVQCEIAAGGSVVGINAVHDGTADIGMSSRVLEGDELKGIKTYQIASDVLAIIVHPANQVQSLSWEQLRQIYHGEITNWSQVGGADLPIIVVQRATSSGTRGAFDEIALKKQAPAAPDIVTLVTASEIQSRVAATPNAIGYVGFGNLDQTVKTLTIDSVMPTPQTVTDGSYPLVRPLFLLTGPLTNPIADDFITFTLSPAGQQIVSDDGWVAIKAS